MLNSREACYYACHISGWQLDAINIFKILYIASINFALKYDEKLIKEDFDIICLKDSYFQKIYVPCFKEIRKELFKYGSERIQNIDFNHFNLGRSKEKHCHYNEIENAVNKLKNINVVDIVMFIQKAHSAFSMAIKDNLNYIPFEYIQKEANYYK